ncbi:hypothetical protein BH20BAC1_BH20BAC1_03810 [soil metagenome]
MYENRRFDTYSEMNIARFGEIYNLILMSNTYFMNMNNNVPMEHVKFSLHIII